MPIPGIPTPQEGKGQLQLRPQEAMSGDARPLPIVGKFLLLSCRIPSLLCTESMAGIYSFVCEDNESVEFRKVKDIGG
jgi:hypothetical protein